MRICGQGKSVGGGRMTVMVDEVKAMVTLTGPMELSHTNSLTWISNSRSFGQHWRENITFLSNIHPGVLSHKHRTFAEMLCVHPHVRFLCCPSNGVWVYFVRFYCVCVCVWLCCGICLLRGLENLFAQFVNYYSYPFTSISLIRGSYQPPSKLLDWT